jgi:hypothetical protein
MHEANDAGQAIKQSAVLTVAQQSDQDVSPCERVSSSSDITVCAAE